MGDADLLWGFRLVRNCFLRGGRPRWGKLDLDSGHSRLRVNPRPPTGLTGGREGNLAVAVGVGACDWGTAELGFQRMEGKRGGHGRFFAGGDDDEFTNATCCF